MAAASISLKPMVQNTSLASPQPQGAVSLLDGSNTGTDFNSWMTQARGSSQKAGVSSDNNLPPAGRELPKPAERAEVKADAASEQSKVDVRPKAEVSSDRSAASDNTPPDKSAEVAQNSEQDSSAQRDQPGTSASEPDQDQSPMEASNQAENSVLDASGYSADQPQEASVIPATVSASTEQLIGVDAQAQMSAEVADAVVPVSTEVEADAMAGEQGVVAVQQGVGEQRVPPGAEHASERGLERGQAFNRGNADGVVDAESYAVREGVQQSQPRPEVDAQRVSGAQPESVSLAPSEGWASEADLVAESVQAVARSDMAGSGEVAESEMDVGAQVGIQQTENVEPQSDMESVAFDRQRVAQAQPSDMKAALDADDDQSDVVDAAEQDVKTETLVSAQERSASQIATAQSIEAKPAAAPVNTPTHQQVAQNVSVDGAQNLRQQVPVDPGSADSGDTGQQSQNRSGLAGEMAAQDSRGATMSAQATSGTATSFGAELNRAANPQADPVYQRAYERMQQPTWGQQLGQRTIMMAQQGPRSAMIQLDPPELGSLQVRLHIHAGDQVSVSFTAPNANVREALEQHLPRLREMFAEQGLNLAQSDVRDQSAQQQSQDRDGTSNGQSARAGYVSAEDEMPPLDAVSVPVGVVDYHV